MKGCLERASSDPGEAIGPTFVGVFARIAARVMRGR